MLLDVTKYYKIETDPDKAYQDFHTCRGEFSVNNDFNFLKRLEVIYRDRGEWKH